MPGYFSWGIGLDVDARGSVHFVYEYALTEADTNIIVKDAVVYRVFCPK